jgi:hypothetical protein
LADIQIKGFTFYTYTTEGSVERIQDACASCKSYLEDMNRQGYRILNVSVCPDGLSVVMVKDAQSPQSLEYEVRVWENDLAVISEYNPSEELPKLKLQNQKLELKYVLEQGYTVEQYAGAETYMIYVFSRVKTA